MADLSDTNSAQSVKIVGSDSNGLEQTPIASKNDALKMSIQGHDGAHCADVILDDGIRKLAALADVTVNSLRGFDPIADTWFYIGTENDDDGTIGTAGDTIRVQIAAGPDASLYPAVDVTYTLTAGDALSDEDNLATNVAANLNANGTFSALWRAQKISGSGCVYITAKRPGSHYQRPNPGDFTVTKTGTITVTPAFDDVITRQKTTSLARDPADPRQGILGIQGSVIQTEGDVTTRFQTVFPNLLVNGSVTPVEFTISADPTEVKFITKVAFGGRGNGIKFGQFLSKAGSGLTNGILVSYKSNDFMAQREPIKTTGDFLDLHAEDPDNFSIYVQAGGDKFIAVLEFPSPLELRPQGEFGTDDYLTISIRDDITSGITQLRAIVTGFNREY